MYYELSHRRVFHGELYDGLYPSCGCKEDAEMSSQAWTHCIRSAPGSALTCLVIILPVPYTFVKFVLFHGMVNVLMIRAGLLVKWGSDMLKAWILLYISGFLTGGVFQFLGQYMRIGSLFFVLAVASYYVVSGIWSLISYLSRQNQYRCQADLYMNGRKCQVQALIDTGNSLRDELTGKPVCILDQDVARELLAGSEASQITLHSLSFHRQEGWGHASCDVG